MAEIKKGIYKHFKGDLMEVIGTGLHSETQEEFVVYHHISGERKDEKYYWVRPVTMFTETVTRDGVTKPRFEYIGDSIKE